jgi:hypothetical protein
VTEPVNVPKVSPGTIVTDSLDEQAAAVNRNSPVKNKNSLVRTNHSSRSPIKIYCNHQDGPEAQKVPEPNYLIARTY